MCVSVCVCYVVYLEEQALKSLKVSVGRQFQSPKRDTIFVGRYNAVTFRWRLGYWRQIPLAELKEESVVDVVFVFVPSDEQWWAGRNS